MKKYNKKSKNPAVLALYAVSILLGIYTIVTVYNSYSYVSSLVSQGLVISDELLNVISYFIENSAPYLFYTISTWAIGYVINKLNYISRHINIENSAELEAEIVAESNEDTITEAIEIVNDEVTVSDEIKNN